ncbi:LLM class flavin-dependent oxidoreductase [Mycolicibacterium goodii]|nr:LLM class flavin-dependent oxidoreductase [Mycolicibacterium goodii]
MTTDGQIDSAPTELKREFSLWSAFAFISPIVAMYGIYGLSLSTAGPGFWWTFVIVLGHLAASNRLGRLRLGIGVTDAGRRNPAVTAQAAATLHLLTRGRAILGIGTGARESNQPYGVEWSRPVARFKESLATIRALWDSGGDPVTRDSPFFPLHNAVFDLPPYRGRWREIWVGAHGPRMLRAAGRYADGWYPVAMMLTRKQYTAGLDQIRTAASDAGRDPSVRDHARVPVLHRGGRKPRRGRRGAGLACYQGLHAQRFCANVAQARHEPSTRRSVQRRAGHPCAGVRRTDRPVCHGGGSAGIAQRVLRRRDGDRHHRSGRRMARSRCAPRRHRQLQRCAAQRAAGSGGAYPADQDPSGPTEFVSGCSGVDCTGLHRNSSRTVLLSNYHP